jgi:hypothetical protein
MMILRRFMARQIRLSTQSIKTAKRAKGKWWACGNVHRKNPWEVRSEMDLVSRVSPVQTALRNCTRDEGRSFEVGNQVLISSHRKLLLVKSNGGERCGKVGTRF